MLNSLSRFVYDRRMCAPHQSALVPVVIEPKPSALLPAIQRDLQPFVPMLRGAASLIAAALVVQYAAPTLASTARQIVLPKPQQKSTILVEEHITVQRRVSIPS